MARTALIFLFAIAFVRTAGLAADDSIPGDADCDGVLSQHDLVHLEAELGDGDGPSVSDVGGGTVVSCSGADANDDLVVTSADLLAVGAFLLGQGTSKVAPGPVVTYFGVASADGTVARPAEDGRVPTYQFAGGVGFVLVIEAMSGPSGVPPSLQLISPNPEDASFRPGLQVVAASDLGNGSAAVCDEGGVPGFSPPAFGRDQAVTDALNDISCRFRPTSNTARACTVDDFGFPRFVDSRSRTQYCLSISGHESFATGGTVVTARLLDTAGNSGVTAQVVIHVGTDPLPTRTATSTRTIPASPTLTPTRTNTGRPTSTRTRIPSRTATGLATRTPTVSPTRAASRSPASTPTGSRPPTASPTRTGTPSRTATFSPTTRVGATATRTPTRPGGPTATNTRRPTATKTGTATGTVTRTPSVTVTATITRTSTRTATVTLTPTITLTPSITPTPTVTRTPTPTRRPGADISFVGVTGSSSDAVVPPDGSTPEGWPIFVRPLGFNFRLVVEGKPGPSGQPVGTSTFNWNPADPSVRSDLEIIVSRALGDGSAAVCDNTLPDLGGIPAVSTFEETQAISNAINDLACRFEDGVGNFVGRPPTDACTTKSDGSFGPAGQGTTVQFCALIASRFGFADGDTVVTVRLRDRTGRPGPAQSFVIRVAR